MGGLSDEIVECWCRGENEHCFRCDGKGYLTKAEQEAERKPPRMPGRRYAQPRNAEQHGVVDSGLSVGSGPRRRSVQIVLSEIKRVWPVRPASPHPPKAKKRRSGKRLKAGKLIVSTSAKGKKASDPFKVRRAAKHRQGLAPSRPASDPHGGLKVVRVTTAQKPAPGERRAASKGGAEKKTKGFGPGALELAFKRAQVGADLRGDVVDAYEAERRKLDATREHWRLRDYGQFGSSPSYDDYDE